MTRSSRQNLLLVPEPSRSQPNVKFCIELHTMHEVLHAYACNCFQTTLYPVNLSMFFPNLALILNHSAENSLNFQIQTNRRNLMPGGVLGSGRSHCYELVKTYGVSV